MDEEGQELLDSSGAAVPVPTRRRLRCRVNGGALALAAGLTGAEP